MLTGIFSYTLVIHDYFGWGGGGEGGLGGRGGGY